MSRAHQPVDDQSASDFSWTKGVLCLVVGAVAAVGLAARPASAQTGLEPPAVFQTADRFGVDVISGGLNISSPTISVGDPAHGGLSFTATWDSKVRGWRYSNWGEVKKELTKPDPDCQTLYSVVYMGGSNLFQRDSCTATTFSAIDGDGTLVETSSGYSYTALDGSVATYSGATNRAVISTIVRPNGEVITYGSTSVSNNRGYQLHFDYVAGKLTKVTALNNAVDACGLSAATCTYSVAWPSLTFTESGNERSVTDGLGQTTRITLDSSDPLLARVVGVSRPTTTSGSSISYTHQFIPCGGYRVVSATDGAGVWTYTYDVNAPPAPQECPPLDWDSHSTSVTDPNGGVTVYNVFYTGRIYWTDNTVPDSYLTPQLYSIKNPLNQTTLVSQSGVGLHAATYPEGNSVEISRNVQGGVVQIHSTPKPGSGLSPTYVNAVYPDCVSEPIRCHFPIQVTSARTSPTDFTNATDYTYDAAGNLLTETAPAPAPGEPRPQTRYTWEQRYAWYKRNGSAVISQAASPVWVMVEQSQCLTGATC